MDFSHFFFGEWTFPVCWVHTAKMPSWLFLSCQVHIVKLATPHKQISNSTSSILHCPLHNAKLLTPHHQYYIVNYPSWLHYASCPNALQAAQKFTAQSLKFIPWLPKLCFWSFSLWGWGLFGEVVELAIWLCSRDGNFLMWKVGSKHSFHSWRTQCGLINYIQGKWTLQHGTT